ncbi:MAG TPA: ImmA/IrrE family metallo-endopeptidase [Thermoanaerobaculia bacterium]|nr:ImmA/IrrE family metallo-endopeptidase [Thermoanaerobaculia bacterium]
MDVRREVEIPGAARKLRQAVERYKHDLWESPPLDPIDRLDPMKIPHPTLNTLNVRLELPEEIPPVESDRAIGNFPLRVGSRVDSATNQITVARSLSEPVFRFTLAHAIAHRVLHTHEPFLSDSPRMAGDRNLSGPMTLDQEANLFAEELLMPSSLVRSFFRRIHKEGSLRDREPDASLVSWLSQGIDHLVTVEELILRGRDYLALLVAEYVPWGEPSFSLAKRFQVAPLAMSIRLQRLHLV